MRPHKLITFRGRVAKISRPLRPANRPVNALTHDQGRLPFPDIAVRNPRSKSMRLAASKNWEASRG